MGNTSQDEKPAPYARLPTGLFDEDTSHVSELHNLFILASEQMKSMLFFDLSDLFAERQIG